MIPWSEIRTDPESLIDSRFLLKTKLSNPTRMSLKDITVYWNHWVSKEKKRDPFSFIPDNSSEKGKEDYGSDKGDDGDDGDDITEKPFSLDHYSIDDDIPLPCQCETPSVRTNCLEKLVPGSNEISKSFHRLVKMVDALKVSSVLHT